ncbi:MMPL family transporter [Paenibacillaceae bacterium WGS1546]|uniref:MMPL family transporter n=1 Tax=Cohnella sp. WGS1546 TaxID=3366810 RepID=UPI00372D80FB
MKKLMNPRTFSLIAWIVATVVILVSMPDMDRLVRDKGQVALPESARSAAADELLQSMKSAQPDRYEILAVFTSGGDSPLTDSQKAEIDEAVKGLDNRKSELGIVDIVTHRDNEALEKQLVSEDGTTILAQIAADAGSGTLTEAADRIRSALDAGSVRTYLTGNGLVMEDFVQSTQEGIKKTEAIAVVFILVVLILVFRSPIVPLISLLTVGVSYLVSMGIVAQLVEHFDYPFSNFTQVFLVVVLFGIGTDYNILLFTRFKEELSRTDRVPDAVRATYKAAGKTVLYSGLAVFIGFMALILAEFKIYRSSSAVAIGVAVLILVLITLNPFFMALLGRKMFWPIKRFDGHGESRIWAKLTGLAVTRPLAALLLVVLISLPTLLAYSGTSSYNDLLEVNDVYESKQGINVIEAHYPAGFSSPANLVIRADRPLDNSEDLQTLDELAEKLSNVEGVAAVYTATRPAGEKINALYINDQTVGLYTGLADAAKGIDTINEGLSEAEAQFEGNNESGGLADVQRLIDGTGAARQGVEELSGALDRLASGLDGGQAGAQELKRQLSAAEEQLGRLAEAVTELHAGYARLEGGLSGFGAALASVGQSVGAGERSYAQIEAAMAELKQARPELEDDARIAATLEAASSGRQELAKLGMQLEELGTRYDASLASFDEANGALKQAGEGLKQMQAGVSRLQAGAGQLEAGIRNGSEGAGQIADKSRELSRGIAGIQDGQRLLGDSLGELEGKMNGLKAGLAESSAGFAKINAGLNEAQDYLSELSESNASRKFYIPREVLAGEEFQSSIAEYMSEDRRTARMMIVLEVNPYSEEAMTVAKELDRTASAALEGSGLAGSEAALGGKSAQNVDLREIASGDLNRTATIMLAGIGIVLIVITRSFWLPVFIIASLLLAYGAAVGIGELIGASVLGVDQLGWNVPFFSLIMIVALGVDYSIFLMMRYREMDGDSDRTIVEASRHVGGIVISAAVILGGTFAALMPSGVLTLIEVAVVVIVGLLFLSFAMLPVFIPALMALARKLEGRRESSRKTG